MAKLTHASLKAMKPLQEASDGGARGGGTLMARKAGAGVLFYFRYTAPDGRRERVTLGNWSGAGGELSLADARAKAAELSARYRAGARDLRAVLAVEEGEAQRERAALLAADEAHKARQGASLQALMVAYVESLRVAGKGSARSVEATLQRHLLEPWPKLMAKPAADVTIDDLLEVVARVADAGKLREADKLRSYLRAAYAAAVRARQSAGSLPALRALKLTQNPARELVAIDGARGTRERALSLAELRAYWRRIEGMDGVKGACLRFHLLTGGQRLLQLAAVTVKDYDPDSRAITLRDPKGRRSKPRLHVVPLTDAALRAMEDMAQVRLGEHLVSLTHGQTGVDYQHLRQTFLQVVQAMEEAGELEQGPFTLGDLRRTVETRLAAAGVSMEIRGQLQSHGLGGVQNRHYDRHDYLQEKRDALEILERLLVDDGETNVVPLRRIR